MHPFYHGQMPPFFHQPNTVNMPTGQTLGSLPLQTPGQMPALPQVDPQKPLLNKTLSLSSISQLATQVQAQSKNEEAKKQQNEENTPQPD